MAEAWPPHPPNALTYLLLMFAGVGTHGTQCLIIAAVADHYPTRLRGSALGKALGVGRVGAAVAPQVGGLLLASGLGVNSNFLAFALASVAAGLLFVGLPSSCPDLLGRETSTEPDV